MSDAPEKWSRQQIWAGAVDLYRHQVEACHELSAQSTFWAVGVWMMFSIPGALVALLGLFLVYNGYLSTMDLVPARHPIAFVVVAVGLAAIAWGTALLFGTIWIKVRRRGETNNEV